MHAKEYGLLYGGPIQGLRHVLYALIIVPIALDYLHDTWFYWTHRLLHTRYLGPIHRMHHQSTAPTAFTGYSFHIIEACIVFANEILVCYLLPIHMGVHRLYHMYTTVIHNGGHAGYEIAPYIPSLEGMLGLLWYRGSKQPEGLNTVAHHDLHHKYPNVHFSLYMTHWDRLMKTEHSSYQEYVRTLAAPSASRHSIQARGIK